MAITLSTTIQAAVAETSHSVGGETFTMSAGKQIQVRDNESGSIVNRLNLTVPEDKAWTVNVDVTIVETDA